MSQNEVHVQDTGTEPLLPIEKKLVGWSLGLGIFFLVVLVVINHLVPLKI